MSHLHPIFSSDRVRRRESARGTATRRVRPCCRARGGAGVVAFCAACVCMLCSAAAFAQNATSEEAPSSDALGVTPPALLEGTPPQYPEEELHTRRSAEVQLEVTIAADGSVSAIEVVASAGSAFDRAAVDAVRSWRFSAARRAGQAVASRVRVPVHFAAPQPSKTEAAATPAPVSTPAPASAPGPARAAGTASPSAPNMHERAARETTAGAAPTLAVEVHGRTERREEDRSSGDFRVERDVLAAAPRQEGADVLRSAPGLYIGRGEGPAVAHNYMLRGFDAEHGQDIEFRVGGIPINLPSHIHGQGHANLGFLIADVVDELRVSEGVYDPRQGDFAVAGSIDLTLGVRDQERGLRLRTGHGSFGTSRQLLLWAPPDAAKESFGAAELVRSDGYGQNRASQQASTIFQHGFDTRDLSFRVLGIVHTARSDLAGVLRTEDIEAGRVCYYCVYPFATAQRQNALATRALSGAFVEFVDQRGSNGELGVWVGYDNFRLQENFTGFIQQSRTLERVAGRGDLIEQQNRTTSLGFTSRYRTERYRPAQWAHGTVEVGADARLDLIRQEQNLLDATVRNQTWDRRVNASVRGANVALWGDLDWCFTRYLRTRLGARADVLAYDVEDRLGNFAPLTRPQDSFISGYRRSAFGIAAGPRTSVEFRPAPWFSLLGAYGEGYRSPQARQLEDGEQSPFTKVHSADLGVRFDLGEPLRVTSGVYYTRLSDDVAFAADEGRLERIGATERLGVVTHVVTRPLPGVVGAVSLTTVRATLLEPPPASAEEPQPPFTSGQRLPFVPPVVVRADLGVRRALLPKVAERALEARAGLGFTLLAARPLPYDERADPVALLDASAGFTWGAFDLGVELFNAFDAQYAAVEYSFPSDWDPDDGVRPRTPARHISAGPPISWLLSLEVTL